MKTDYLLNLLIFGKILHIEYTISLDRVVFNQFLNSGLTRIMDTVHTKRTWFAFTVPSFLLFELGTSLNIKYHGSFQQRNPQKLVFNIYCRDPVLLTTNSYWYEEN